MIIHDDVDFFLVQVDSSFRTMLYDNSIYQTRTGMENLSPGGYEHRFNDGDVIRISKSTSIEPFSTFAGGYQLHTCGSFTSICSELRENTVVGRYSSISPEVTQFGFRHPLEAVSISSAVFNFNRENISGYFDFAQERDGMRPCPIPVPTPQPHERPLIIGHDVWIGSNVQISGGITIGHGAVIAANSLVTRDVAPYTIVAGSPAQKLKLRFPPEICDALLESQWWNYELSDMHAAGMDFSNPAVFLRQLSENHSKLRTYAPRSINIYHAIKKIEMGAFKAALDSTSLILTCHGTLIVYDSISLSLKHVKPETAIQFKKTLNPIYYNQATERFQLSKPTLSNPFHPMEPPPPFNLSIFNERITAQPIHDNTHINFKIDGKFVCAGSDGNMYFDRDQADTWERFSCY